MISGPRPPRTGGSARRTRPGTGAILLGLRRFAQRRGSHTPGKLGRGRPRGSRQRRMPRQQFLHLRGGLRPPSLPVARPGPPRRASALPPSRVHPRSSSLVPPPPTRSQGPSRPEQAVQLGMVAHPLERRPSSSEGLRACCPPHRRWSTTIDRRGGGPAAPARPPRNARGSSRAGPGPRPASRVARNRPDRGVRRGPGPRARSRSAAAPWSHLESHHRRQQLLQLLRPAQLEPPAPEAHEQAPEDRLADVRRIHLRPEPIDVRPAAHPESDEPPDKRLELARQRGRRRLITGTGQPDRFFRIRRGWT